MQGLLPSLSVGPGQDSSRQDCVLCLSRWAMESLVAGWLASPDSEGHNALNEGKEKKATLLHAFSSHQHEKK